MIAKSPKFPLILRYCIFGNSRLTIKQFGLGPPDRGWGARKTLCVVLTSPRIAAVGAI